MNTCTYYKNVIWTKHAIERLGQRGVTQELAYKAFANPDIKTKNKKQDTTEFQKRIGKSLITIIAKQNEKKEWVIISCWIDPSLPGSIDKKRKQYWQEYKKASFLKKFWIIIKKQLGLYG